MLNINIKYDHLTHRTIQFCGYLFFVLVTFRFSNLEAKQTGAKEKLNASDYIYQLKIKKFGGD
ncbi:MAG: hypothetical protein DRI88_07765 [Bacteroidetes bacterium]|nr:MAG: hypothetical protein DRI72_06070 [Bacteroidota bacterium]RLD46290.1 MAG: hypothetical protein DRI88_07765 [Bacteroidota bacterium]RLD87247.1 MAG: hypothetical protein DRJ02_06795 [Bacteroidota bacterium]